MIRALGKTSVAYALTWTGATRLLSRIRKFAGPTDLFIVCYHRVVEDFTRASQNAIPSLLISTSMLERHIDWLASRYNIVSLDEIGGRIQSGRRTEKLLAAITFDDGYSDVYHNAYPLLKRKGIPGAVFVVTGLADTGHVQIFDRLYLTLKLLLRRGKTLRKAVSSALQQIGVQDLPEEKWGVKHDEAFRLMTALLKAMPSTKVEKVISILESEVSIPKDLLDEMVPLTWPMIERMHADGITIGSHTKSHSLLTSENPDTVWTELRESRQMLEARLKAPIEHFAYPDGRFKESVVQAVESAGFRYAYSICRWHDPRFPQLIIPRKVLWEKSCLNAFGQFSPSIMHCQANWAFDRECCSEHDHVSLAREGDRAIAALQ